MKFTSPVLVKRRSGLVYAILCLSASLLFASLSTYAQQATPVRVSQLKDVALSLENSASATVISLNTTEVAAQVSGVINRIHVEVGNSVATGDLLAELDCADYQQGLQQANSTLNALKARQRLAILQLDRARKLLPTRNISEEQVNQRQTEFDMSGAEIAAQNAAISIATRQVSKCAIKSPFVGVVSRRISNQGAFVSPGTPVVEVIDTQRLEIVARLNLNLSTTLPNTNLQFVNRDASYAVELKTLLPVVEASSRTREARLVFVKDKALAGTPGRLVWTVASQAIPAYLLISRQGRLGIFVAENGMAKFVSIEGALQGRPAAVTLPEQTPIITDGRHGLKDGDLVSLTIDN
ncbi:MAG: RND family efflux transporter MFP subunit [Parasphingorhabdus sp.]|jgi:RND family efflux transporter MFP subunit